jgi:hypothetical protein
MRIKLTSVIAALISLGVMGVNATSADDEMRLRIANSYGLSAWDQVQQLRYTFNVDRGKDHIKRSWLWDVKKNAVTFEGPAKDGKPVKRTYVRTDMKTASPEIVETDRMFINDEYWLLFPLHVKWDNSAQVADKGTHALPIGKGTARRVVVTYPSSGGYTPGDMYELFIDPDIHVVQWAYHRGGPDKGPMAFTWEDNRSVGPLTISMNHRAATPDFRVWFTDVAVKLIGSEQWVTAK